jgi:cytochrome bd-type quinol oxidase subunit 2
VPGARPLRADRVLTIGSFVLAIAPKCPICLWAYFGVAGAAGAATSLWGAWIAPVTAAWLVFTVVALAWKAEGRYAPAALGLLASIAILAAKFRFDHKPTIYAGLAALFVATIWRAYSRRRITRCASLPTHSSSPSSSSSSLPR